MSTNLSVTALAAALCSAAGLAMAQDAGCCSKGQDKEAVVEEVRIEQPAADFWRSAGDGNWGVFGGGTVVAQPETRVTSRTVMIQRDGEHEYKVELDGDKVQAWIDGERVPKSRVKVSDDQISLKGEDGQTLFEFARGVRVQGLPALPRRSIVIGEEGDSPLVWETEPDQGLMVVQPAGDHPPVMIGINMGPLEEVGDEVQEILDDRELGTEDVIVVIGVVDGLPAEEAGVEDGDIIVRIDGDWGVNPEKLREILMDKEPGDEIELLVLRDGKRREIMIELAPYDPSKLGQSVAPTPGAAAPFDFYTDQNQEIQELMERLQHEHEGMDEDLHQDIQKLIERLHQQEFNQLRQLDEMPRFRIYRDDQRAPRALVTPRPPAAPSAPAAGAMRDYQERFDRIEERLDRLEQRIERLINAMESRERDGG